MRNNIERLIQLLTIENENYESLKQIEAKKTEVLVQGDMTLLFSLLNEQEGLANSLQNLQKRRLQLQKACAEEKGMDSLSTLGDLVKQFEASELTDSLTKLRQDLLDLVKELGRLTHNNEILILQNIEHIKEVFNIMTGQTVTLSYGDKGENTNLGQRAILDKSA
jgi:flagellar biosynthesis/type III secretory pathway chaperone